MQLSYYIEPIFTDNCPPDLEQATTDIFHLLLIAAAENVSNPVPNIMNEIGRLKYLWPSEKIGDIVVKHIANNHYTIIAEIVNRHFNPVANHLIAIASLSLEYEHLVLTTRFDSLSSPTRSIKINSNKEFFKELHSLYYHVKDFDLSPFLC